MFAMTEVRCPQPPRAGEPEPAWRERGKETHIYIEREKTEKDSDR